MTRKWLFIILGILLALGIVAIWFLSSVTEEPIPAGLAQDTTQLTQLARERLFQGETNYLLTITLATDRRRAWVRGAFSNKCISYTMKDGKADSRWQLVAKDIWTIPTPLRQQDVNEITRLARTDYYGMTMISWRRLRQLPKALAQHWSFRVLSLDSTGTTAEVRVGTSRRGYTYRLQKGPTGWLIVEKNSWVSLR